MPAPWTATATSAAAATSRTGTRWASAVAPQTMPAIQAQTTSAHAVSLAPTTSLR
jgi:hypothetical protein